jgi:hypothetical protein
MSKRLAVVCLVLLVLIIGGCGGGDDRPVVISGDYYPLRVGTTWVYDTVIQVETASDLFTTTGTFTRNISSLGPLNVGGKHYNAYAFDQTATVDSLPVLTGAGSRVVAPAVTALFSPAGGLQPVTAYYVANPAADGIPANVTLVALAENGAPPHRVPATQPLLLTPPYRGTAEQFGTQFIPTPLLPPSSTMTNLTVRDKLLDYSDLDGLNGRTHAVTEIYYFQTDVNLGGTVGQLGGRGRNFFLDGLGLASGSGSVSDWSGLLQVQGQWARITVQMTLRSMS